MGAEYLQKIQKALRVNSISKDIRIKILQEGDLTPAEIGNRQTQAYL